MTERLLVVGVDGGRTSTRVRVEGPGVTRTVTGPGLPVILAPGGADQARDLLGALLEAVGAGSGTHTLALAVNGLHVPHPEAERAFVDIARALAPGARIAVASDVVAAYLGALGTGPGVVVSAGTGAVVLALDEGGHATRLDGWGPLVGDRGSGWWIGRAALEVIAAHADGAGDDRGAALAHAWEVRHGAWGPSVAALYAGGNAVVPTAAFAPDVLALADAGDPAAVEIAERAADALAATVAGALGRVGTTARVSWSGGLLASDGPLLDRFRAAAHRRFPSVPLVTPAGSALDGALALARAPRPVLQDVVAWHHPERTP